jgi:polar amino acid transport system substrate-binding protein
MTNDLIALFKDTSVVSIIAIVELSKKYQILTKTYGDYLYIGALTAGLYLLMSVPLGWWSRRLEEAAAGGKQV